MSAKKTYSEWLDDFKKEIEKGYSATTMVTALAERVYRDKAPTTLFQLDGPPRASIVSEGEPIVPMKVTLRNVIPLDAGFVQSLGDWSAYPEEHYMGMFMNQLGKYVADKEYSIIVKGMESFARDTVDVKQKGKLSTDDIRDAQNHAEYYFDSAIISHQQMAQFWIDRQIIEPIRIPLSFVPEERRGYYYSGMMGAVNIYWANFIKDFALVFDRREIICASEPLTVRFDSDKYPKQIILKKLCVSAPIYDQAVVKVKLT